MASQSIPNFIVIDDDPTNNMICLKLIEILLPEVDVQTFVNPIKGLEHIDLYDKNETSNAIIFLDINMFELNGWEVLDIFDKYPEAFKKRFKIFMLSSSIYVEDRNKATNNPNVSGFIEKPLSLVQIKEIIAKYVQPVLPEE